MQVVGHGAGESDAGKAVGGGEATGDLVESVGSTRGFAPVGPFLGGFEDRRRVSRRIVSGKEVRERAHHPGGIQGSEPRRAVGQWVFGVWHPHSGIRPSTSTRVSVAKTAPLTQPPEVEIPKTTARSFDAGTSSANTESAG